MEITAQELNEKIENGEKLIVDFGASWCGPCSALKPIFEKVASTTDVQMFTLNIEENKEVAASLGIRAIPTIKSFNDGKEVSNNVGMIQETRITQLVNELING
jgi:thioredoxin 1